MKWVIALSCAMIAFSAQATPPKAPGFPADCTIFNSLREKVFLSVSQLTAQERKLWNEIPDDNRVYDATHRALVWPRCIPKGGALASSCEKLSQSELAQAPYTDEQGWRWSISPKERAALVEKEKSLKEKWGCPL